MLVAPMDGTVTFVAAKLGSMVSTSTTSTTTTTFITISDLSRPSVLVSIDEADMAKFVAGNKAEVTFDALPDTVFTGVVSQVEPQTTTSGRYQVVTGLIQLDQTTAKAAQNLLLGLSATIVVISKEAKNALLVPVDAVRDIGNQQYSVFVLGSDGKLSLKIVQVGLSDGVQTEVTSGLSVGELVTTVIVPTAK